MSRNLFNEEQKQWFLENQEYKQAIQVADEMNQIFGLSLSAKQIREYRKSHRIKSNFNSSLLKTIDNKWNKKTLEQMQNTMFKVNRSPHNTSAVGTVKKIRIGTYDYWMVKVDDKPYAAKKENWIQLHRLLYQIYHSCKLNEEDVIIFADGNRDNVSENNLVKISKATRMRMNNLNRITDNSDVTKSYVNLTNLELAISKKKRKNK